MIKSNRILAIVLVLILGVLWGCSASLENGAVEKILAAITIDGTAVSTDGSNSVTLESKSIERLKFAEVVVKNTGTVAFDLKIPSNTELKYAANIDSATAYSNISNFCDNTSIFYRNANHLEQTTINGGSQETFKIAYFPECQYQNYYQYNVETLNNSLLYIDLHERGSVDNFAMIEDGSSIGSAARYKVTVNSLLKIPSLTMTAAATDKAKVIISSDSYKDLTSGNDIQAYQEYDYSYDSVSGSGSSNTMKFTNAAGFGNGYITFSNIETNISLGMSVVMINNFRFTTPEGQFGIGNSYQNSTSSSTCERITDENSTFYDWTNAASGKVFSGYIICKVDISGDIFTVYARFNRTVP